MGLSVNAGILYWSYTRAREVLHLGKIEYLRCWRRWKERNYLKAGEITAKGQRSLAAHWTREHPVDTIAIRVFRPYSVLVAILSICISTYSHLFNIIYTPTICKRHAATAMFMPSIFIPYLRLIIFLESDYQFNRNWSYIIRGLLYVEVMHSPCKLTSVAICLYHNNCYYKHLTEQYRFLLHWHMTDRNKTVSGVYVL